MKLRIRWIVVAAAMAAGLWIVQAARAQSGDPGQVTDDQVNKIARQLYCPVCENIPLDVCGTQACADWREEIRSQLAQGWSEQQIKDYFANRFGDRVLNAPPPRGLNWLVYVIPPVAIVLGAAILATALRTWRRAAKEPLPEPPAAEPADEYVRRLEEELKRR